MIVFLIVVLVLVVGAVIGVVVGRVGTDAMSAPVSTASLDTSATAWGERGPDAVRFDQALRGYNMAQVDAVLDALFEEIRDLREGRPAGVVHPPQGVGAEQPSRGAELA